MGTGPGLGITMGAIHIYGPPPEDPISRLVEYELGWKPPRVKIVPRTDIAKMILTVSRDPLAMGVVDLSQMPAGEAAVRILAITPPVAGATAPTRDRLPPGYWMSQAVDLWVSSEASQEAKDFADYLDSGACAAILARHGLVPGKVR